MNLVPPKIYIFFLLWIFGFFLLLSIDLFFEGFVFEWLEWNRTTKNDWFFALWWGIVVIWFLYGSFTLYIKMKDQKVFKTLINILKKLFYYFLLFTGIILSTSHLGDNYIGISDEEGYLLTVGVISLIAFILEYLIPKLKKLKS